MSELGKFAFIRRDGALVPADIMADDFLGTIKPGSQVLVAFSKPRSIEQHNYFFALLRVVFLATDRWLDEDDLLDSLKETLGYSSPVIDFHGRIGMKLKSISWAAMDGNRFRRFFDRSMAALAETTGIDPIALIEETDKLSPRPKALADLPGRRHVIVTTTGESK